jgi:hypothetical protein
MLLIIYKLKIMQLKEYNFNFRSINMEESFNVERKTIECWGRNGYFWITECMICNNKSKVTGRTSSIIDCYSRIKGGSPPMQFIGDREELLNFFSNIILKLKEDNK